MVGFRIACVISKIILSLALALVPLSGWSESHAPGLRMVGSVHSPPVSYVKDGEAQGLLQELSTLLAQIDEDWTANVAFYPWSRAQWLVENGLADMFCTYPSQSRQEYAFFTETPAFIWEYGNLVFRKDNPNADQIRSAKSFEDLKGLIVIGQYGSEWESENIPAYIERELVASQEEAMKVLLLRGKGDFLVMSSLEATYFARKEGLEDRLAQAKVEFIPDSHLPFHFGISKKMDGAEAKIAELELLLQSAAFKKGQAEIMNRYTKAGPQ